MIKAQLSFRLNPKADPCRGGKVGRASPQPVEKNAGRVTYFNPLACLA